MFVCLSLSLFFQVCEAWIILSSSLDIERITNQQISFPGSPQTTVNPIQPRPLFKDGERNRKKLSVYAGIHRAPLSHLAQLKNITVILLVGLIGYRCCTWVALLKAPSGGTWCVPSAAQYNAEQGCGRRSLHVAASVLIKKKESASVSSDRYKSAVCQHTSDRNKLALPPSVSLINPVDFYQRFCVSLHWLFLGNEHCSVTHIQSTFRSPTTALITGLSWI